MAEPRVEIPGAVKRQLRQEAGFGCCVCGNPVFQYHHIRRYTEVRDNNPDDLMVLCPNHHHEATVGAFSESEQRRWKALSHNIVNGYTQGLLCITEPGVVVRLASNDFVSPGFKIQVDAQPLLSLDRSENGLLELSLDLYDSDDRLLLTVVKNEWITGDPLPWDIEFGHRWLVLRDRVRRVAIRIDARRFPIELRGELWRKGQRFEVGTDVLLFDGVVRNVGIVELGLVGMNLRVDTSARTFSIAPDPKYGEGRIVSWPDRAERLSQCFAVLERLEKGSL